MGDTFKAVSNNHDAVLLNVTNFFIRKADHNIQCLLYRLTFNARRYIVYR